MEGGISGRRFSYRRSATALEGAAGSSSVLIRRSPEEIRAQPDKLNLDGRGLDACPTIEGEDHSLRLLSLKSNRIAAIGFLGRLSALIFLDLYGNRLTSLEGLSSAALPSLRVLMVGRNKIRSLAGLRGGPPRLDVLDAHGNELEDLSGLESCGQLRVLNLASNNLRRLGAPVRGLCNLTELNLRRNALSEVADLGGLTSLQRLNLSGNALASPSDIAALSALRRLTELSLAENPMVDVAALLNARPAAARQCLSFHRTQKQPSSDPAVDEQAVGCDAQLTEASLDGEQEGEAPDVVAFIAAPTVESLAGILSAAELGRVRVLGLDLAGLHRRCILELAPRIAQALSTVRKLRLCDNDISSFSELKRVLELFPAVSYLQIEDNGVCQSPMLRSFCSAVLPQLALLECQDFVGRPGASSAAALSAVGKPREPEALDKVVNHNYLFPI